MKKDGVNKKENRIKAEEVSKKKEIGKVENAYRRLVGCKLFRNSAYLPDFGDGGRGSGLVTSSLHTPTLCMRSWEVGGGEGERERQAIIHYRKGS